MIAHAETSINFAGSAKTKFFTAETQRKMFATETQRHKGEKLAEEAPRELQNYAFYAFLNDRRVEIDEKAETQSRKLHICNELSFMHRQ